MSPIFEGILQGLFQWIYGLFLDLLSYCANALLGIMSTDLTFWETSVPVVGSLYHIFISVGWGLLIGNCAFQSLKAMFAGLGFETESPAVLLFRTGIFGTLLIFSRNICNIGLSIGKNIMNLIGVPTSVNITTPEESMFESTGAGWLLVIIIGFILGFQLIKLFFEIAERYVVVAVLTLLCPMGLAMGGSKSTKDICTGFIRTYASMIVMMVMNVLFLKLILSALATMPSDTLILPWCLLVVGIAKTARKADNLISKIGLSPAITGDPLGHGRGSMMAMLAARTIINSAAKSSKAKSGGKSSAGTSKTYNSTRNRTGGTHMGGANIHNAGASSNTAEQSAVSTTANTNTSAQNAQSMQNSGSSRFGAPNTTVNSQSTASTRFGSASHNSARNIGVASSGNTHFSSGGQTRINTNRFGAASGSFVGGAAAKPVGVTPKSGGNGVSSSGNTRPGKLGDNQKKVETVGKNPSQASAQKEKMQGKKGIAQPTGVMQKNSIRFGSLSEKTRPETTNKLRQNVNPFKASSGYSFGQIRNKDSSANANLTDSFGVLAEEPTLENNKEDDGNG